jgi:hypothetical protein
VSDSQNFKLRFGANAPPFIQQLLDQHLVFDQGAIAGWQRCADSVTRCHIYGVLTEREATLARKRILRQICKLLRKRPA